MNNNNNYVYHAEATSLSFLDSSILQAWSQEINHDPVVRLISLYSFTDTLPRKFKHVEKKCSQCENQWKMYFHLGVKLLFKIEPEAACVRNDNLLLWCWYLTTALQLCCRHGEEETEISVLTLSSRQIPLVALSSVWFRHILLTFL